jgi:hypothetical protein
VSKYKGKELPCLVSPKDFPIGGIGKFTGGDGRKGVMFVSVRINNNPLTIMFVILGECNTKEVNCPIYKTDRNENLVWVSNGWDAPDKWLDQTQEIELLYCPSVLLDKEDVIP